MDQPVQVRDFTDKSGRGASTDDDLSLSEIKVKGY